MILVISTLSWRKTPFLTGKFNLNTVIFLLTIFCDGVLSEKLC